MKTTTITNPDGSKTVIKTENRGGCSGCLLVIALLFVIGAPAAYFPTFWATVAYVVMGILAVLYVIGLLIGKTKEAS
jgi:hypothetical protein